MARYPHAVAASSRGDGPTDPSALIDAIDAGDEEAARRVLAADPGVARARPGGRSLVRRAGVAEMPGLLGDLVELAGELSLADAAVVGDVERVQEILDADPDAGWATDDEGYTALHLAAWFGQVKVAELLLNRGAGIDAVSHDAHAAQPINVAAFRRQIVIVHLLLDHGADIDATMAGGFRPLHAAADSGDAAIVRVLLDRGADPNARNDAGQTAADVARTDEVRAVFADL